MNKLVIRSNGTKACIKTPLFAPALICRIFPGFGERCMGWLYSVFGGRQTLEAGRYIIRWSGAQFALEVK